MINDNTTTTISTAATPPTTAPMMILWVSVEDCIHCVRVCVHVCVCVQNRHKDALNVSRIQPPVKAWQQQQTKPATQPPHGLHLSKKQLPKKAALGYTICLHSHHSKMRQLIRRWDRVTVPSPLPTEHFTKATHTPQWHRAGHSPQGVQKW